MKKYLALLSVFILCSVYIFYKEYSGEDKTIEEGDAPIHTPSSFILGGTTNKPNNDDVSIGKLQTSYIMYTNGDIDFDQMMEENITNLEQVLNFPFNPLKGYLFSVGYDDHSKVQYYYQSDQEETRTAILRVEHGKESNSVSKIYDGEYLKLVSVDEDNMNQLIAYDYNNDAFTIEVN